VVDSSFIVEALLKRKELFEKEVDNEILSLDFALYEVANSIWKHENLIKDLNDGSAYLEIFLQLIESGEIRMIQPSSKLLHTSYQLASRRKISVYDAVFVALALELGVELRTFDKEQKRMYDSERRKKVQHSQ